MIYLFTAIGFPAGGSGREKRERERETNINEKGKETAI